MPANVFTHYILNFPEDRIGKIPVFPRQSLLSVDLMVRRNIGLVVIETLIWTQMQRFHV